MKCLSEDELVDHLFGADRSAGRADAEAHFLACAVCRARMETLKQLKTAAASVPPAPVSGDFTARLMRKLQEQEAAPEVADIPALFKRLYRPAWGLALAAFAVALVLSTAYFTGRRIHPENTAEALYFSDGPATVNSSFSAAEERPVAVSAAGKRKTGYVYTDNCATVNCGIL